MFKFDKQVDQELEEGQISDDGVDEPQRKQPIIPVVSKLAHREDEQSSSREYVIQKVRMKNSSPTPQRKKDRKQQKAEEKSQYLDRRKRPENSPEKNSYPMQQQLPPVNPYFVYPPQGMYQFPPSDPRAPPYIHMGQNNHPNMNYPYIQHMPHWQGPQNPQNLKMMQQYQKNPQHQSQPGYHYPHYQKNSMYPPSNSNQPGQSDQRPSNQVQNSQNPTYYSNQDKQQSNNDLKKKQIQQQQKQRLKKIQQLKEKIKEKIVSQSSASKKQQFIDLLLILRSIITQNYIGDNTLKVVYKKLQEDQDLKEKFYQILSLLQLKDIQRKLKEKQLEMKVIGEEKKMKGVQLYQNLMSKDPRLKMAM